MSSYIPMTRMCCMLSLCEAKAKTPVWVAIHCKTLSLVCKCYSYFLTDSRAASCDLISEKQTNKAAFSQHFRYWEVWGVILSNKPFRQGWPKVPPQNILFSHHVLGALFLLFCFVLWSCKIMMIISSIVFCLYREGILQIYWNLWVKFKYQFSISLLGKVPWLLVIKMWSPQFRPTKIFKQCLMGLIQSSFSVLKSVFFVFFLSLFTINFNNILQVFAASTLASLLKQEDQILILHFGSGFFDLCVVSSFVSLLL